jgi:lipopolysaccharide export system permease protein
LLGLVVLAINETVAPIADERAREIMESHNGAAKDPSLTGRIRELRSDDGKRDWVIDGGMSRTTGELSQPQVRWIEPEPGAPQRIHAQSATFSGGEWAFSNADVWMWGRDQSTIETNYRIKLPETPAWIHSQIKLMSLSATEAAKRPQLSIKELISYLRLHPHLSEDKIAILVTQLYGRIAAPFTCVAVALIAFPFGARSGRHNVFVGVASSIFICFSYFILQRVSFALGTAGYLSPALAAWLPNLLFGGAGIFLMTRL